MSGSPRRSCEGSWPLWVHRPGAEVSRAAQLLGRACPPRLPPLLCLLPARSAALQSPRPFPQQWGRGPRAGRALPSHQPESPCGVGLRRLRPLRESPDRVPVSAPFLTAKVTCSPLPVGSQLLGEATRSWAPGSGGGGPPECMVPRGVSRRPASSYFPLERRGWRLEEEKVQQLGISLLNFFPQGRLLKAAPPEGSRTSES